ncbi:MAG: hypothetical protein LAO18_17230 [Acidobacteriia bacterium]|nr:hypothetical protein [Terriglobia bacterium]
MSVLLLLALSVGSALAGESPTATAPSPLPSILPAQFAGWHISGSIQTSKDPAVADSVNADLLKEYGLTDFESGTYTGEDGRKVALKAIRFADASGAYGAFTYYKMPQMLKESIPDQGSSLNERVLFYRGNILVDAVFEKLSAMSAASLRELSQALPRPAGNAGNLPSLPAYLPKSGYVKNTAKYVMGPVGLDKISAPLSAQLVDFNTSAEVAMGTYQTSGGVATLMLIAYPTPQLAAEHLRRIDAANQPNAQPQSGSPIAIAGPMFDKRTGPMVVIATGVVSQAEARALLSAVNYEADVTWNENTYQNKKNNLANLLLNVFLLCGILIVFAGVAGLAFGGIRIFFNRILPEHILHREKDADFISLNLSEGQDRSPIPR